MALDYQSLMNEAVLNIVKKVLIEVQSKNIEGNQGLYISFLTNFKDVVLSESVKKQYPKEITIVLQHQFRNLKVLEDKFSVNIAFKGINEDIEVPFNAITSFLDPVANFGFQFTPKEQPVSKNNFAIKPKIESALSKAKDHNLTVVNKKNNVVIAIDKFRKSREADNKPS